MLPLRYVFHSALKQIVLQECIPVGCVPPAAVAVTGGGSPHLPQSRYPLEQTPPQSRHPPEQHPQSEHPPGAGTPPEQTLPRADTPQTDPPQLPLGCGPGPDPPQLPPWLWAWRPPLETCCKACWDTTCNACWDSTPPPMDRMTDTCKNISKLTNFVCGR